MYSSSLLQQLGRNRIVRGRQKYYIHNLSDKEDQAHKRIRGKIEGKVFDNLDYLLIGNFKGPKYKLQDGLILLNLLKFKLLNR